MSTADGFDRLVVNVDGGARGNPGPAAIGVVVATDDGLVVDEHGETIGRATNNVAEYRALLAGIERARALGGKRLELLGDSELVVKQVQGAYKVKNADLKPLHAQVRKALAELDGWEIRHIKRAANAEADRLVNEALDASPRR
ncbi:MAG: ribonuclease HI family protein [Solirubrobacterales bacterium]